MSVYYPPVGFHFKVEIGGFGDSIDARFSDVAGLSEELVTEEVAEGGQNRFVQKYPVTAKHPELTLKRGLLKHSELVVWVRDCIENFSITPRDMDIKLLNEEHEPLLTWHLTNAYPVKWAVTDLSATSNSIVVESLQFFYQTFSITRT
ncbi:phage tail protein [Neiella marina]|uniref:Phage tail protein n=1 Tax=Neiella marina TaxID=508461 RepID=A0A8J2U7K1_9GAMM|nr:phage tail protein [Neiella marina]GGA83671.1 phage tail protein [Neiella marina]